MLYMKLTSPQRLMLFSLGQFYERLNQPLVETPLQLRTSKIAFIELLLDSRLLAKHERALYKNVETLEQKKMIAYHHRMIKFTEAGLRELEKMQKEVSMFENMKAYFQQSKKPQRKLQTTLD